METDKISSGTELKEISEFESKPLLQGPKRHHFLPQFYLEGFTKDGKIAVYDRELDEIRIQAPINTCVIGHFYTFTDSEGRKRFELEKFLSEYESKANIVISKLAAYQEITDDERSYLSIFIALATCRTPDIVDSLKKFNSGFIKDLGKKMFSDVDEVKERIREGPSPPDSEEELENEARYLVEFAQSDQYEVKTNHVWAISMAMQMAFEIAPLLAEREWIAIHRDNPNKSFVTTDSPVLLTTTAPRKKSFYGGVGFGNSDALVLFPMRESCILALHGNGASLRHMQIDGDQIRRYNLGIAQHCQRFVIARDEDLVVSLVKRLDLANKKWLPKMRPV